MNIYSAAALNRLVELTRLVGDSVTEALLLERQDLTMRGLGIFLVQGNDSAIVQAANEGARFHGAKKASCYCYNPSPVF